MKLTSFYALAIAALLASSLGSTVQANAAAAAPTPVPYTMPNLSAMKMFMGTWHCSSTAAWKDSHRYLDDDHGA